MLIETRQPVPSLISDRSRGTSAPQGQYMKLGGHGSWVKQSDESLASSAEVALMQMRIADLVCDPFRKSTSSVATMTLGKMGMFRVVVDRGCFERAAVNPLNVRDRNWGAVTAQLQACFEDEPLEDGMKHPGEQIINTALHSANPASAYAWLRDLSVGPRASVFAADVMRCIGRQPLPGTNSWRAGLIRDALKSSHVELRDAAAQAADMWGDAELGPVLRSHSERVPWLRSDIEDIIAGLTS